MDSCFVLFGTCQHGVANLNNASERANANKLPNVHYIKFRTLNSLVPRITHCHITCFGGQEDQSVTMMSHKANCPKCGWHGHSEHLRAWTQPCWIKTQHIGANKIYGPKKLCLLYDPLRANWVRNFVIALINLKVHLTPKFFFAKKNYRT